MAKPAKRKPNEEIQTPSDPLNLPSDHYFREVADFTNDWESWHGIDGRLIWVNPAVERLTGRSVAECLAMDDYPLPLIFNEDQSRVANILQAIAERTTGEQVEFRCIHTGGEMRWMSLSWQPMYTSQGKYLGMRTSVRDVTDLHKLRDELRLHAEHLEQLVQERTTRLRQLEQRQRQMEKLAALGQLAAGVAHEINNPLAGVRNAFELIKTGLAPDHEHFELIELIDREIERISEITHQMYQLYRQSPLEPSPFSMARVIGEVVYLLKSPAAKRGVILLCSKIEDSLEVNLAEGGVKQILYNLIRNAIQASPPGGDVQVHAARMDSEIAVSIQDRGEGISEEVAQRMFDPFFSTKQSEPEGGMGLGLSVSGSLIESMGGRIEVDSKIGQGSKFTAVFPSKL